MGRLYLLNGNLGANNWMRGNLVASNLVSGNLRAGNLMEGNLGSGNLVVGNGVQNRNLNMLSLETASIWAVHTLCSSRITLEELWRSFKAGSLEAGRLVAGCLVSGK